MHRTRDALGVARPLQKLDYRCLPLNLNMDNRNPRIIPSHVETTSQFPECYSACFIWKNFIYTWSCLFELSGTHLCFLQQKLHSRQKTTWSLVRLKNFQVVSGSNGFYAPGSPAISERKKMLMLFELSSWLHSAAVYPAKFQPHFCWAVFLYTDRVAIWNKLQLCGCYRYLPLLSQHG